MNQQTEKERLMSFYDSPAFYKVNYKVDFSTLADNEPFSFTFSLGPEFAAFSGYAFVVPICAFMGGYVNNTQATPVVEVHMTSNPQQFSQTQTTPYAKQFDTHLCSMMIQDFDTTAKTLQYFEGNEMVTAMFNIQSDTIRIELKNVLNEVMKREAGDVEIGTFGVCLKICPLGQKKEMKH